MVLTDFQVSQGYYTLPNVDRAINPSDPLGLWDVYSEDRAAEQQEIENKEIAAKEVQEKKTTGKFSYADAVKNKSKKSKEAPSDAYAAPIHIKKSSKESTLATDTIVMNVKSTKKRTISQLGEDFIVQQPRKIICLSEKAELDSYFVASERCAAKEKKKISLDQYRQRKALKVVRRKPMVYQFKKKSYADALKSKSGKSFGKFRSLTGARRPLRALN